MHIVRLSDPREKLQCALPKEELNPTTIGWKGYREQRTRINQLDPNFCMRFASWQVDGIKMCTQHAGMHVLESLKVD